MSQNQGGLSEDELRDYINEKYSLRLERDVFIKPNKDVIIDIYQRFLDEVVPFWRRYQGAFKDCEEPAPIKSTMVRFLRLITKIYNNSYLINAMDLIAPTRQRTRLTLNILIYHRERTQDILAKAQEDKEELMLAQEEVFQTKQEIARLRERVEQSAIAISTSRPVEELRLAIIDEETRLDAQKKVCEEIAAEAKDRKSRASVEKELFVKEESEVEECRLVVQDLKKQLEILNSGLNIGLKAANTERMISDEEAQLNIIQTNIMRVKKEDKELERLVSKQRQYDHEGARFLDSIMARIGESDIELASLQASIERLKLSTLEHQKKEEAMRKRSAYSELQVQEQDLKSKTDIANFSMLTDKKKSEIRDLERALLKEQTQIGKNIEEIKKTTSELKLKLNEELDQHKRHLERASRKAKLFEDRYLKSRELSEKNLVVLAERKEKFNNLMGVIEKSDVTIDMPANRTYIKSQE